MFYFCSAVATLIVGIALVCMEVEPRSRVILVSLGVLSVLVFFLANNPVIRVYDMFFIAILGFGCIGFWYMRSYF